MPYTSWEKERAKIFSRNRFDELHFMSEDEIYDWIDSRYQRTMYKDAEYVD